MTFLESLLLALTLILSGGYAGIVLMVRIGILPGLLLLSPGAYADAWRAMDRYMDRRMPPYKASLLLLNLATVVVLAVAHRTPLAVAAGVSLGLSVVDVALTVRDQLPLNAKLQALPADAPDGLLVEIRDRTVRGIGVRFALAASAFVVLCAATVGWPIR